MPIITEHQGNDVVVMSVDTAGAGASARTEIARIRNGVSGHQVAVEIPSLIVDQVHESANEGQGWRRQSEVVVKTLEPARGTNDVIDLVIIDVAEGESAIGRVSIIARATVLDDDGSPLSDSKMVTYFFDGYDNGGGDKNMNFTEINAETSTNGSGVSIDFGFNTTPDNDLILTAGIVQGNEIVTTALTYDAFTRFTSVVPVSAMIQGEGFTLDDGTNPPVTFVMDPAGSVVETSTNRSIPLAGGVTEAELMQAIAFSVALANAQGYINIVPSAGADGFVNFIELTNIGSVGAAGNTAIVSTVSDPGFTNLDAAFAYGADTVHSRVAGWRIVTQVDIMKVKNTESALAPWNE